MQISLLKKMAAAGAAAAALAFGASSADATCTTVAGDIKFDVSGTFTDGGTLSGCFYINTYGYFDYNAPWALVTTTGTSLSGYTYDTADAYLSNTSNLVDVEPGYEQDLHIVFTNPITQSGPNPIVVASTYECVDSYSCYTPNAGSPAVYRFLEAGTPGTPSAPSGSGTVPEPASWALMILGTALTGAALRHRRRLAV